MNGKSVVSALNGIINRYLETSGSGDESTDDSKAETPATDWIAVDELDDVADSDALVGLSLIHI